MIISAKERRAQNKARLEKRLSRLERALDETGSVSLHERAVDHMLELVHESLVYLAGRHELPGVIERIQTNHPDLIAMLSTTAPAAKRSRRRSRYDDY